MLGGSLLGVGTVLRLDRDAWSVVKRLKPTTNEYAPLTERVKDIERYANQGLPLTLIEKNRACDGSGHGIIRYGLNIHYFLGTRRNDFAVVLFVTGSS